MAWTLNFSTDLWPCSSNGAKRRYLEVKINRESSFSEACPHRVLLLQTAPDHHRRLSQRTGSDIQAFRFAIHISGQAQKKKTCMAKNAPLNLPYAHQTLKP